MKKILLKAYLANNLGDDLFVKIIAENFKNVEFWIINNKDYINRTFKCIDNVKIRKQNLFYRIFKKLITQINKEWIYKFLELEAMLNSKKYDAVVIIGGSMFIEEIGYEYAYREQLYYNNSFSLQKKPYFILGSNFGPFKSNDFYKKYKLLFSKCYDVSFREQFSKNLFKLSNVRCNPDMIFALQHKIKNTKKQLGVSVIDLSSRANLCQYEKMYYVNLVNLIKLANKDGYEIVLLSFCEREGDMNAVKKLIAQIPSEISESIIIHNYVGNMKESLDILSQLELVIATRFHSMILSQVFGQGVLPYIYSDKTLNVLNDMNFNDLYFDIRENREENIELAWKIMKNNKIDPSELQKKSINHFSKLKEFLNLS